MMLLAQGDGVYVQHGQASFYADKFNGRLTANGERFSNNAMTAAHLTLPFNSVVRVTNKSNGKYVDVRINDRGPFVKGRIIDLTKKAAKKLEFYESGLANVKIQVINMASGNDKKPSTTVKPTVAKPAKREFYQVKTSVRDLRGYGVQVGSFKEMMNLMDLSNKLHTKYGQSVYVEVMKLNGQKMYRVFLGAFSGRSSAESLLKQVKRSYPDAFVKDYSKK
ncbi:septal ring lytic transglycosylase RlpA family protein [Aureibacter tunicatorum]|uniref:Probable endolytic peptidoglycan transglycosylase RlpA n=2 Tax=Aureibacter tunicatorum TaxID=866807 RepID=A0AAE3XJL5_9BACT|nr:septal ring lytic transglycosylase RlpA family protein [Aureibacter tunicatorum]MDR6237329.1 rare lipoprotein A [Aureibacter tunicatorum]